MSMLWGISDERGSCDARGNGRSDEATLDDEEVCVDEGVVEHFVGGENDWVANSFISVFS